MQKPELPMSSLHTALPPLDLAGQPGPVGLRIADLLRDRIVTNRLQPGQALAESEVATLLGVSRQPVREALIRLSEGGLVRILPQRGTLVTRISLAGVEGGRFVRDAVERAVVRRAAEVAPPGATAVMHRIIDRQEAAVRDGDHPGFLALDDALHGALAAAMGHSAAWTALAEVKLQMDRVRYLSIPDGTPSALLIAQHRSIVEAIARRDADAAEAAMRLHLSEVLAALPKLTARFPNHFETSPPAEARGAA
jgi:DNA-binding GntR family transcriptional regulator